MADRALIGAGLNLLRRLIGVGPTILAVLGAVLAVGLVRRRCGGPPASWRACPCGRPGLRGGAAVAAGLAAGRATAEVGATLGPLEPAFASARQNAFTARSASERGRLSPAGQLADCNEFEAAARTDPYGGSQRGCST